MVHVKLQRRRLRRLCKTWLRANKEVSRPSYPNCGQFQFALRKLECSLPMDASLHAFSMYENVCKRTCSMCNAWNSFMWGMMRQYRTEITWCGQYLGSLACVLSMTLLLNSCMRMCVHTLVHDKKRSYERTPEVLRFLNFCWTKMRLRPNNSRTMVTLTE